MISGSFVKEEKVFDKMRDKIRYRQDFIDEKLKALCSLHSKVV